MHKHGGRYKLSLKIYDGMIKGKQANANILLELRRERAEVTYLLAVETNDLREKKHNLEAAKEELETYIRQQDEYRKKMMTVLYDREGIRIVDEIDNNYSDARSKLSDIDGQLIKLKDLPEDDGADVPIVLIKGGHNNVRLTAKL
jgi:hypothetical protein